MSRFTHALIWLTARDRATGAAETLGLWTGADHRVIAVGGQDRTYFGVGAVLGLEDLVAAADLKVSDWSFELSSLHAQVIEAFRIYDARLAPVEVHLWDWDPVTGLPKAAPERVFRGTIMEVDLPTPPEGGTATASVRCVSDAWRLTRGLTLKRSSAALLARHPGDKFRQYNEISGAVQVAWGEKLAGLPGSDGGSGAKANWGRGSNGGGR